MRVREGDKHRQREVERKKIKFKNVRVNVKDRKNILCEAPGGQSRERERRKEVEQSGGKWARRRLAWSDWRRKENKEEGGRQEKGRAISDLMASPEPRMSP